MNNGMTFFTATCLNWQHLLEKDQRKEIIINSLRYLVEDNRIWLYGFVIMPNHIHLLWSKQEKWFDKNIQQMFLKYMAQQIKFLLVDTDSKNEFEFYRSSQNDRMYHFWERRPYKATMYNRQVAEQKLDYIHNNPVKAGLCQLSEEYKYSTAAFYELNRDDWGFITHYAEHI